MPNAVRTLIAAVVALVAVGAMVPSDAAAHEGATGIVKERMALMSRFGKSVKTTSSMLRGKVPWDAAKVRRAARLFADHGGEGLTRLFPDGSLQPPTDAKPAIWKEWRRFADYADELRLAARALAEVVDPGEANAAAKAAFRRLTGTCRGCHKDFRKPEH